MNKLDGKKTYLVSLGVVLSAVGVFLAGEVTLAEAINAALVGLGLATVKHAVTKGPGK